MIPAETLHVDWTFFRDRPAANPGYSQLFHRNNVATGEKISNSVSARKWLIIYS